MQAVKQGNYHAVNKLLVNHVYFKDDVLEIKDKLKRTALAWASLTGRAEIVRLLVQFGADPVSLNENKDITPLHYAAAGGHDEIVRFYCRQNVDLNIKDMSGSTPLSTAVFYNRINTVKTFIHTDKVDEESILGIFI